MSDEAYALAALEAGFEAIQTSGGTWNLEGLGALRTKLAHLRNARQLAYDHPTPIAALAAAARALGLQPKWVVVDRAVIEDAMGAANGLANMFRQEALDSRKKRRTSEADAWEYEADKCNETRKILSSALSPEGGPQS